MAKIPEQIQKALLSKAGEDPSDFEVSLNEIESFGNSESLKEMVTDVNKYRQMLKERITFINPSLTTVVPFTRENLYLICAYSGNGKSTIAANISYPLWQQQKKILVISNEESKQDVIFRIACLHLGENFNEYKKGRMPLTTIKKIMNLFPAITQWVKVIDVNYKDGLTTKAEGIENLLEAVRNKDFSCVMIDYYQLAKYSARDPSANPYTVLDKLRIFFGKYIKNSNIPIVVFAQLHSMGKRNNKDLDSRIKDCPAVYEPSTVVIEVVPDFENQTSDFKIHKDRFGAAGFRVSCGFDKGKFVDMDEDFVAALDKRKMDDIEGKTEKQEESPDGE